MSKLRLPIYDMSIEEFSNFKSNYLDGEILNEEAIDKIKELFDIGKKTTARIHCDEYHPHSFKCVRYNSPEAGIVERLINERNSYRSILDEIHNKTKIE